MDTLVFGWRTALLSFAVVQLLLIAAALTRPLANRTANRTLAALLVVLVGMLTPYVIGFAGFYDTWPWLSFAPFAIPLAVAPLLWLYILALVDGHWPNDGWRHLIPAVLQLAFLSISFALPMPAKMRWADTTDPALSIVTGLGTVAGLAIYGIAGLRLLARYRAALADERSDDARFAARWLSRALGATLVLLPVWTVYTVWDAVAPLGYFRLLGLHLAIAAFALFLAVEGWRHAALPFPRLNPPTPAPTPARDWRTLGQAWAAEAAAQGWAADPDLTVATLARRLGTNTAYLSRALNDGLGMSFSTFVNRLRSESVAAAIDAGEGRDLLDCAFAVGFASKASFNRAFRARYGVSPSAYRRASKPE